MTLLNSCTSAMPDVLMVGGGVVGLSLAWRLAQRGFRVHLIDRGEIGKEASWAGAGIIPAAVLRPDRHPYDQFRGLACSLHREWSEELKEFTGIDNGFRRCGAIHLARQPGEAAALSAWIESEREEGIEIERLDETHLWDVEPGLAVQVVPRITGVTPRRLVATFIRGEAQLRNPRHLKALFEACKLSGVAVSQGIETHQFERREGRLIAIETSAGRLEAGSFCFTAGAWTGLLLNQLELSLGIIPIRGQMILYRCDRPPIQRIINEGSRYLVPRDDGHVLAGSTEEEAGFEKATTPETQADLTTFACGLVPALSEATIERTWAGLRPGSLDGLPYMGSLPGLKNAFVAAGHFRSGLYLSTATAVVMSQLICGEPTAIDLSPFRVGR